MTPRFDVVVVGAGLAGLAASSALARAGAKVAIVDRRPFVGGRAYSYAHPVVEEIVDSQHVLVGACTALRKLCTDAGVADRIRWYDAYTFLEPGGRRSVLQPGFLPSPGHNALSFLRAGMLGLDDKIAISRGLMSFLRGSPSNDAESVAHWLQRTGQPEGAVRHFWRPVVISALNDSLDRCSMKYAGQVFHETFLKSAEGGRFGIPSLPLSEFYGHVAEDAVRHGAALWESFAVRSVSQVSKGWEIAGDREVLRADKLVLAVPFDQVAPLLAPKVFSQALPLGLEPFRHSPITTIHLWYDREVTDLDHAALLDTTIEWMFHKSRIRGWDAARGSYVELTISASHPQLKQSPDEVFRRALTEFEGFFPAARTAVLRKHLVLKEAKATFSVVPGLDRFRPSQETPVQGLFLAGDWTRTGWPSTMEGAVRSGYLAAEVVTGKRVLPGDLPAAGLMKVLAR